jgi:hypothetical protein
MTQKMHQNFERASSTIQPIDRSQYDETILRLKREDCCLWHPRLNEIIVGCSPDARPSFISKDHARIVSPATPYHQQMNRSSGIKLSLGKIFAVSPRGTCTIIPNVRLGTEVRGKPTSQWKSSWFSKGMRRQ